MNFEEGWKGLASRSSNQISIGLHFFVVPLFGLLCYLPYTQEKNIGDAFLNFLGMYLPYALLFGIISYITGRNLKLKCGMKFDKAVIISWISSGIGFFTFAVLMQSFAILTMFAELGFMRGEKINALVVYILVDILFAIIILKFPKRIINQLNKWPQTNQGENGFIPDSKQYWISGILIIIISFIGFLFSGFQEFKNFLLFMSGNFGGFLAFFFCISCVPSIF